MTYKLITEAELQQAIDALELLQYDLPDAHKSSIATLRAVQEREGPKLVAWRSRHVTSGRAYQYNERRDLLDGERLGNAGSYPSEPLYSLPEIPQ